MIQFFVKYKLFVSLIFYCLWFHSLLLHIFEVEENIAERISIICKFGIFLIWLVVMLDIMTYKVRSKIFWVLSMLFISFFAPIVYIYRRENLFHSKRNRFKTID